MSSKREIRVFESPEAVAAAAAEMIVAEGRTAVARRGRFVMALSGGGTPGPVFRLLADQPYRGRLPWDKSLVLWADERSVPPDDPGSNYGQASRLLLDHVPIPAVNVHRIRGELGAEKAAAEYRAVLAAVAGDGREWPRLDLALMGMGRDGHTASLFPGRSYGVLAAVAVSGEYDGRPAERVSLTPVVFNDARMAVFVVTGAGKAEAVAAVLNGAANSSDWPAAGIQPVDGRLVWLLDRSAAGDLTAAAVG